MQSLAQLLTDDECAAIRAPIEKARTLPKRTFTCPDFYALEVEKVLKASWLAVSFGPKMPNPGDLFNLTVLGMPILLVRGTDHQVRAFHNICPYDGCEVSIRRQSGIDSIITPYHGWEYSLDGKLLGANYFDGSPHPDNALVDSLDADLQEIPCTVWMETVFVWLGNKPIPFEIANSAVIDHFTALDVERLSVGSDKDQKPMVGRLKIRANWKTVYENYSPNVYHESFVHAMYRASPHSPRVDADGNKTYTEINDPSGFLGLCYDNNIGSSFYGENDLPPILNKDGTANTVNTIANVFPNWVTTVLGDAARVSIFLPDGPENGEQQVMTLFDRDGAQNPDLLKGRTKSMQAGLLARREDNEICESIQRARHSPACNTHFYAPFWDAMHYTLNNLILDRLEVSE